MLARVGSLDPDFNREPSENISSDALSIGATQVDSSNNKRKLENLNVCEPCYMPPIMASNCSYGLEKDK